MYLIYIKPLAHHIIPTPYLIGGVAEADPESFCAWTLGGLHFPHCPAVGSCDLNLANGMWEVQCTLLPPGWLLKPPPEVPCALPSLCWLAAEG